jgi:hypothetical protein
VLDAVVTVWLMHQGFGEANPVLAWMAKEWSIPGMAIVKIAWSFVLLVWLVTRPQFHKYVNYLIIGYFVLYTGGWWAQFLWEARRIWTQ